MKGDQNVVPLFPELEPVLLTESSQVEQVFSLYQKITGRQRSRLDLARRKLIAARLDDGFTLEDLEMAFYGVTFDAWHQGENDRRTKYDGIELICRDAAHVEKFIDIAESVIEKMKRRQQAPAAQEAPRTVNGDGYRQFLEQAQKMGVKVRK